jgi:heme-degrading monooxygenase HmoA
MIARMFHGWTARADAGAYEAEFRTVVLEHLRQVDGFVKADLLRRDAGDEVEFVSITWFRSLEAIRAFAGDDLDKAVISAGAAEVFTRYDERVQHYEVALSADAAD